MSLTELKHLTVEIVSHHPSRTITGEFIYDPCIYEIVHLANGLPSLSKLTSMKINLIVPENGNGEVDHFLQKVSNIPKLTHLELSLSYIKRNRSNIQALESLFAKQKSLVDLRLDIQNQFSDRNSGDDLEFFSKNLSGLTNLKVFHFMFDRKSTGNSKNCIHLASALMQLPLLSTLKMHFFTMNSESFSALQALLLSKPKLTKLKLHFDRTELKDEYVLSLAKTMAGLTSLTSVYIKLDEPNVSDGTVLPLAESIALLPRLRKLYLGLHQNPAATAWIHLVCKIIGKNRTLAKVEMRTRSLFLLM
eukprot:TRINITY_DN6901_c0_g1_i6.p1 TRINITY_DN6901_c0_g1~~TRINITY_DN6901_c0_g1_i6.p1  ORF type:complete len:305 (+),score=17.48 TRINITY_DN6901_c0_g1_i6:149-1063(+)